MHPLKSEAAYPAPHRRWHEQSSFMREIAPNAGLFGEWLQYTDESKDW